jgi:small ligand-binding sensory domain FIST
MTDGRPRVGAGVSTEADPGIAATRAADAAAAGLPSSPADLAVVFASGRHLERPDAVLDAVHSRLAPVALIGCGAGGVLGGGREHEDAAGVAVWALSLGGAGTVTPFQAEASVGSEEDEIAIAGDLAAADATILLTDPYSFATDAALIVLGELAPAMPVLGGIASGRGPAGTGVLFAGDEVRYEGAVGVRLDGVEMLPCVSQGAAPLGRELTVTRAEGNVILELAGRPAVETIEEVISELKPRERALVASGLMVGIVVDSGKPEFEQGDFLVRGVLGADRSSGAIAIADLVREGQIVRLHARDARSADEDLRRALRLRAEALGGRPVAGALVFSCNGRGRGMFGVDDHDAGAIQRELGGPPTAGFFAAGEIGPVAGRSFLHSFTATVAIFPG